MSRRLYLETTTSGKQQIVSIKRSRSHGHRHRVDHEYFKVSIAEWDGLKERERCLEDNNRHLVSEISSLKASLATAQGDAHHLRQVLVPQLQQQMHLLSVDNDSLRKTVDNASRNEERHSRDAEKLKDTIDKLENEKRALKDENHSLKSKIKQLQQEVESGSGSGRRTSDVIREAEYWRKEYRYWKDMYEDVKRNYDDSCLTLRIRTEKMRAYEEILKRRRII
ncbi:uncharacterized protein MAM_04032 [Metarhizium album ARSEF 1941]|uniref:Uncharacterized protein n=1 Tax=Metarhizium album (strain ARSEF 1941) TaxID=1081103 RepID=A0A0B2WQF7_METAS|nr:uncharacterized protein MAM_04032 [Metarhizium album ARSEF 1941]KHN98271.1 hypothetical protein MAM_04032 [Metarhizium album ARSEF 1941]